MVQSYRNKNSRTVLGYTPSYRNIFNPSPVDPIKKALQQIPKGWEWSGSPYWKALELLKGV
jgi:hypothetical protein